MNFSITLNFSALAINTGLEFVSETDGKTEAFLKIFEMSFLRSYLDFDAQTSLEIAKTLSLELNDFPKWVKGDFEKLAKNFVVMKKIWGSIKTSVRLLL